MHTAADAAILSILASLTALPLRLVFRLMAGGCAKYPRDHAASWCGEIDLPGDGREFQSVIRRVVDDVLLARAECG